MIGLCLERCRCAMAAWRSNRKTATLSSTPKTQFVRVHEPASRKDTRSLRFVGRLAGRRHQRDAGKFLTETVNFGVRAARVSPHNKLSFYLMSILSDSAGGSRAPAFANTLRGGYSYEVNVSRRSFSFSFTDFEHDQFQGLSLRLVGGGGMGFNLVKNPKTSFQIFSGGSVNREHFRNGIARHSREFVLGNDFVRQVNRNVSVTETLFMYPNLSDRGQYRVNLDSSIVTRLNNWLGWQVTVSNRYVSNPAGNNKNNDLLLTTGIRFMHRPETAQNGEDRPEFHRR